MSGTIKSIDHVVYGCENMISRLTMLIYSFAISVINFKMHNFSR